MLPPRVPTQNQLPQPVAPLAQAAFGSGTLSVADSPPCVGGARLLAPLQAAPREAGPRPAHRLLRSVCMQQVLTPCSGTAAPVSEWSSPARGILSTARAHREGSGPRCLAQLWGSRPGITEVWERSPSPLLS